MLIETDNRNDFLYHWPCFTGKLNQFDIAEFQERIPSSESNNINISITSEGENSSENNNSELIYTSSDIQSDSNDQNDISNLLRIVASSPKYRHPANYERNRIAKRLQTIGKINIQDTPPYKWMKNQFGRPITQKEFSLIYLNLKTLIPGELGPNRDASRNQKVMFNWLCKVWEVDHYRLIVMNLISQSMMRTIKFHK
ncbi:hypothetical protein TRFO_20520 [Tritrichomonas foetus]|uniref:Uncharacterized protein n=1 Tax=Tritrichomonas foetus TaxID=1144522 RepID=A0A1J4KFM0_9EUKA|nr:hypothetical protein TRFO_20520 [Tritrichomonas foetus]|eukprot:OHT10223.1 hypothetical protein TRFO_20520 [Tritrichomonas foetus]